MCAIARIKNNIIYNSDIQNENIPNNLTYCKLLKKYKKYIKIEIYSYLAELFAKFNKRI